MTGGNIMKNALAVINILMSICTGILVLHLIKLRIQTLEKIEKDAEKEFQNV